MNSTLDHFFSSKTIRPPATPESNESTTPRLTPYDTPASLSSQLEFNSTHSRSSTKKVKIDKPKILSKTISPPDSLSSIRRTVTTDDPLYHEPFTCEDSQTMDDDVSQPPSPNANIDHRFRFRRRPTLLRCSLSPL